MRKFLDTVTITGADESVDPKELARLTYSYPFVEWGILTSPKSMGEKPRYPGLLWFMRLAAECQKERESMNIPTEELSCSLHICGKWARDIIQGNWDVFDAELPWDIFHRFQLNISPYFNTIGQPFFDGVEREIKNLVDREIIFQINPETVDLQIVEKLSEWLFDLKITHSFLYDKSGGKGIIPTCWVNPLQQIADWFAVGFAGGLNPHILEKQLEEIATVAGTPRNWIDVESAVRTDEKFDLALVEMFLKKAEGWVTWTK